MSRHHDLNNDQMAYAEVHQRLTNGERKLLARFELYGLEPGQQ